MTFDAQRTPIRFATIGSGSIVERWLEAARGHAAFRHDVVYSRTQERADAFASAVGATRTHTDLSALAEDDAIDAVYIASPNALHVEHAAAMLRAGKHVLLEKPATITAGQWDMLCSLAREHGVVLLEAMRQSTAWDLGSARVAELLEEIGPLRTASITYCQRSSRLDRFLAGETPTIFSPAMGAGSLMDIGVYPLHSMVEYLGVPARWQADAVMLRGGIDGAGTLLAHHGDDGGCTTTVRWSKISDGPAPSEFAGECGTLLVDAIADPRRLVLTVGSDRRQIETEKHPINMTYEIGAFLQMVEGTRTWQDPAQTTAARAALMDGVRDAIGLRFPAEITR